MSFLIVPKVSHLEPAWLYRDTFGTQEHGCTTMIKEETVKNYARQYGWDIINPANMKAKFMDMVKTMDMSFSYKPVLLKAMFEHVDDKGRVIVEDIVNYFYRFLQCQKRKRLDS